MDLKGKRIILASGSPRRREILSAMDLEFETDTETYFEEKYDESMPHELIPSIMSEGKSHGFHRPLANDEILLTSDTMVLCGDRIMGKPRDREEAAEMLRTLSGCMHRVVTAVTLRDKDKEITFSDTSYVYFRELSDNEIYSYIDKYQPFDKAGSYAVQEWIGCAGISRIDGSYYTIMGLPAHRVYEELAKFIG